MRVLLMRRRRSERGAVAVIVALLAVALLVMGALVVDFGMAYVNKNRAQEAADAGALAAGKVYADAKAYCSGTTVQTADPLPANALAAAEEMRAANMPDTPPGALSVTCPDADGAVTITYSVAAKSPVGLGALVSGEDHIDLERHATVKWGTSQKTVGSLRPWMICAGQLPVGPLPNKVIEIGFPGNGHKPPPAGACEADQAGSWWITSCNGVANGNQAATYQAVASGCDQTSLAPLPTPAPTTPAALGNALLRACNTSTDTPPKQNGPWVDSTYCMKRDSGYNVKTIAPAWKNLLGQTIAMPVFCDTPQCSPSSLLTGSNGKVVSQAEWPIWKIAAATVCGYALHGAYSSDPAPVGNGSSTLPTGDCNNLNTDHLKPTDFDSGDTGFLLIFKGMIEPGGLTSFPVDVKTTLRLVE
jgi:Flp pilus assembly protein TadG